MHRKQDFPLVPLTATSPCFPMVGGRRHALLASASSLLNSSSIWPICKLFFELQNSFKEGTAFPDFHWHFLIFRFSTHIVTKKFKCYSKNIHHATFLLKSLPKAQSCGQDESIICLYFDGGKAQQIKKINGGGQHGRRSRKIKKFCSICDQ